jgi:hypothetical protein
MKKIILAILMTFGIFTMVSADIGVKLGVSAQIGSMEASGSETNSTTSLTETSENKEALFATGGFFIEKDLAFLPGPFGRLSIGFDNIVHDLDLGTADNARKASLGAAGAVTVATVHKLDAEITGFETLYATLNITDWLYVKAGSVTVDVDTKFTGSATSTYATNHSLDGTVMGFGVEKSSDNGMFFRLEYNDYDIDGKTVSNTGTDSVFSATLKDVSGSTGRISIGKAF